MSIQSDVGFEGAGGVLGKTSNVRLVRVTTLIGTIITQFALGSVYTWSLFNAGLAAKLHVPVSEAAFSFGLLSLCLALASSVSGKLQERFGVTRVTIAAGVLMAAGLMLTAHVSSLVMLYLCAGIMVGLADGAGYLMTLTNCVRWFPDHKGIISALSIGAYGLGSLGFKYINIALMNHAGLGGTFMYWGVIAFVVIGIGGLMMTDAPKQKVRAGEETGSDDFTLGEAMRRPQFWMLALIFLTNCMGGLYVIGVAKDVGQQYAGLTVAVAANAVAVIAAANLLGRLVLGVLSDKLPRIRVVTIALAANLLGIATLLILGHTMATFYFAVACIAFSFGGMITVYPSLVSDFFGLNNLAKNYGAIYLGFGIGSLLGSVIAAIFGAYVITFGFIGALLVVCLLLSLFIRTPHRATA